MVQWVKALAMKPNDLSLIFGIHKVEERTDLSWNIYIYATKHVIFSSRS